MAVSALKVTQRVERQRLIEAGLGVRAGLSEEVTFELRSDG